MERYQVILAYDGTEFGGFQRQGGTRTVQDVVEKALRQLGWQDRAIKAAGRTDAGVHATGQVAAFDLKWQHSTNALGQALNAHLPGDVAVRGVREALPDFDPRRDAFSRTYQYHVFCEELRNPVRERYAWRVWPPVELDLLQQAAEALIGEHDFAAFGSPPRAEGSTIRMVRQAVWQKRDDGLVFWVTANAFLYHMVRHMVALQTAIGQGKISPLVVPKLFEENAKSVQGLAHPGGLYLTEVRYPPQRLSPTVE